MSTTETTAICVACGGPRNFDKDGVNQERCYDCYDHSAEWSKEQLECQLRVIANAFERYVLGQITESTFASTVGVSVPNYLKLYPRRAHDQR